MEGWPTLMTSEMAARYLSLEAESFARVAHRFKTHPVALDRSLLRWRKSDLDLLVKRLAAATTPRPDSFSGAPASQPLSGIEISKIAEALALRLGDRMPASPPALLSIKEASVLLGIGRTTLYQLIKEGKLRTRRIGSRNLVPLSEVQAFQDG